MNHSLNIIIIHLFMSDDTDRKTTQVNAMLGHLYLDSLLS